MISRLTAAASIALIVGAGGWYYLSNQYSNEALFAELKNTPQLSNNYKSAGTVSSDDNQLKEAVIAFEHKKYDHAITLLTPIPSEHPVFAKAQLNLGHVFFMKGRTGNDKALLQKAIGYYDLALTKELDISAKDEIEWFRLLAYFKMNKTDVSFHSELMTIVNNENHRYSGQARKLLDGMNTYWYKLMN